MSVFYFLNKQALFKIRLIISMGRVGAFLFGFAIFVLH